VTDSTAPSDHSAEAFGAALATIAAVELRGEALTPAELNERTCWWWTTGTGSPSRLKARLRGAVRHSGMASLSTETTVSALTEA
jgi:hypothetical protein